MKNPGRLGLASVLLLARTAFVEVGEVKAEGGRQEAANRSYRVLAPIESGNLLMFPVIRANGKPVSTTPFLTLDEGIKSGQVEMTEAGRVRGLVRQRGTVGVPPNQDDLLRPVSPPEENSYRERRSGGTETFVLESLLPGTGYDVHISKLRLRNVETSIRPPRRYDPQIYR